MCVYLLVRVYVREPPQLESLLISGWSLTIWLFAMSHCAACIMRGPDKKNHAVGNLARAPSVGQPTSSPPISEHLEALEVLLTGNAMIDSRAPLFDYPKIDSFTQGFSWGNDPPLGIARIVLIKGHGCISKAKLIATGKCVRWQCLSRSSAAPEQSFLGTHDSEQSYNQCMKVLPCISLISSLGILDGSTFCVWYIHGILQRTSLIM